MSDALPERDAGLAAERTELAWGRSAVALLACGAAVIKGLPKVTGNIGRPVVGAIVLLLGALIWASGVPYARARARATRLGRRPTIRSRELALIAAGTATVGVAALVIGAFFPG
jgi:uncharacterized membrane protein YidH (DUF202 family)